MRSASANRLGLAGLVSAFALLLIAATPPRKPTEAYTLQVNGIDVKSVRVSPFGNGAGAELSLRLRKAAQPELRDSWAQLKLGRVRIMDGGTLVTEARLSGTIRGDRDKLVGLVLSFKTAEEANRIAAALRSFRPLK
jgi:hypothetical protein